ncbi:MAG TPA: DUF4012 domain-containing protein [Ktedonobacterales bacterium]
MDELQEAATPVEQSVTAPAEQDQPTSIQPPDTISQSSAVPGQPAPYFDIQVGDAPQVVDRSVIDLGAVTAPRLPRAIDAGQAPVRAAPQSYKAAIRRWSPQRKRTALIAIILACFLLGFGGIYGGATVFDALSAARDAKAQAQVVQGIIKGGQLTESANLLALQYRLRALNTDLSRIQADLPGGPFAGVAQNSTPAHALRMGLDLTAAGLYAVDAGLAVAPHIKAIISSVTGGASNAANPATNAPPLTAADITRANADVTAAGRYVMLATAERAKVTDHDLQALGFGSYVSMLHKLDALAPQLATYLEYGQRALAALPDLLGITKPVNYLLLDLDSDELRPSGGFQGVFGILTFDHARLTSGVHLKNIYALDCPNGFPPNCAPRPLPSGYSWFTYPDGLRNANLDPNYPATARLNERMLGVDHGPAVAGVISITPFVIQQALALTGPVNVSGYPQKLSAQNFSELIHYYHSIIGSNNIAKSKAFDAAAGSALLKAIGRLSQSDQNKLLQLALSDLRAGDIQVYLNDTRVESVLADLGLDGALRTPTGDTFAVVNTNHGANYANTDVTATQSDRITIDAQGNASHTLTITYKFPVRKHLYTSALVGVYRDFIQTLAPARSHLQSITGCPPVRITEPGWADFACNLTLWRGSSATVVFKWSTPNATITTATGASQYNLLVQRQAGTRDGLTVAMSLPAGARLLTPLANGMTLTSGQVRYTAALTEARAISFSWVA